MLTYRKVLALTGFLFRISIKKHEVDLTGKEPRQAPLVTLKATF